MAGLLLTCREFLVARTGVADALFLCDRRGAGEDMVYYLGDVSWEMSVQLTAVGV
jgi:hypothetical protein